MKKYHVELLDQPSATVTARLMVAGDGFVRFYGDGNEDSDFDDILIACFSQHTVVSVREVPAPMAPEAPELPTLSRKHPVYTYGKGDLAEALRRARDMCAGGRQTAANYLNDILRDLHKGK